MAAHSSMLAWRIPWTEEPGGLQSMWSQRVRATDQQQQRMGNRQDLWGVDLVSRLEEVKREM